jgi:hypothetical protein
MSDGSFARERNQYLSVDCKYGCSALSQLGAAGKRFLGDSSASSLDLGIGNAQIEVLDQCLKVRASSRKSCSGIMNQQKFWRHSLLSVTVERPPRGLWCDAL